MLHNNFKACAEVRNAISTNFGQKVTIKQKIYQNITEVPTSFYVYQKKILKIGKLIPE